MSQRSVDLTWLPPGKFIVNCFVTGQMFLTDVPSMMNMDVAPVSAIACKFTISIALRYWGEGAPNKCLAGAANDGLDAGCANISYGALAAREQFNMAIVTLSSPHTVTMLTI